ncbi:cytochrome P450 [Colletotrichum orchidophilum]|uniref:Cytochrome P450 n=1 Tax=Colletotrichum orchidophilum TaxID=1209926 RepID=A0A1G4BP88_9PEZI|nr:cytochrome P450 [Colletotrichum orchidophilum]OHF03096.1 cytochrome P450 [Colletotrichum orchidophilum]
MGLLSFIGSPAVLILPTAVLLYFLALWILSSRRPPNFPPGPTPVPILGNVHQIPPTKPFIKFHEWAQAYGDIVGIKVGAENYVILSSAEHVRELFEKRGALYSDRPQPYITSKLINPGTILFMNNDPSIKKTRTALRNHLLGPAELGRVVPVQAAHAALLMRRILEDPGAFHTHLRHWALATPLSVVSGQRVVEGEGRTASTGAYFATQDVWLRFLTPAQAPPVELFPVMKYLPAFAAGWKREAAALKAGMRRTMYHMLEGARAQAGEIAGGRRGRETESLMAGMIRDGGEAGGGETAVKGARFGDHELAVLGAGTLDAAVDTVIATTGTLVLIMGAYPEVQRRLQEEVDALWPGEAPGFEDLDKAKYMRACLTEAMRWRSAAPSGVPRVLAREDVYRGFTFPQGTTFLLNTYGIHKDERWYDRPDEFVPERYLANPWGVRPAMAAAAARDKRHATYNFGAGRRMCPGLEYAENQILMTMAKLAWEFTVVPAAAEGVGRLDTSIETGFHSDLVMGPERFEVDFVPRGEERRRAILEDAERAEKVVEAWVG